MFAYRYKSHFIPFVTDDARCDGVTYSAIEVKDRSITQPKVILTTIFIDHESYAHTSQRRARHPPPGVFSSQYLILLLPQFRFGDKLLRIGWIIPKPGLQF